MALSVRGVRFDAIQPGRLLARGQQLNSPRAITTNSLQEIEGTAAGGPEALLYTLADGGAVGKKILEPSLHRKASQYGGCWHRLERQGQGTTVG